MRIYGNTVTKEGTSCIPVWENVMLFYSDMEFLDGE